MSTGEVLKSRWEELNADIDEGIVKKWWLTIETHYGESNRHYHTLEHILEMFKHFDRSKSKLNSPREVAYAIYFHDLVYDPKSSDKNEEESTKLFQDFIKDASLPKESSISTKVSHLIALMATHLTEEHTQDDAYGSEDEHYLLDFDMAILGSGVDDYDNYADKIKQEYHYLPEKSYKDLRVKVLKSFLQIPKIFATKEFHEAFEAQARSNIQREIDRLQSS